MPMGIMAIASIEDINIKTRVAFILNKLSQWFMK
jgi:hypothetical protein